MKCERCGKETDTHKCSWFNKENICMECADIEAKHPKFKEAKKADREAVKAGNYNFQGIGLPEDYASFVEQIKKVSYKVFQPKKPHFCSWQYCVDNNIAVVPSKYKLVYEGKIDREENEMTALENIYFLLNMEHPADYRGHSLSMGDVVQLGDQSFYVDRIGFREIAFETIAIAVYRDTVEGSQYKENGTPKWDTNIAEIQVTKEFALKYWEERKQEDSTSFEGWLGEFTCDDTEDFYNYAVENSAVLAVRRWE